MRHIRARSGPNSDQSIPSCNHRIFKAFASRFHSSLETSFQGLQEFKLDSATSITSGITNEVQRSRRQEKVDPSAFAARSHHAFLNFSTRLQGGLDSATSITSGFNVEVQRNRRQEKVHPSAFATNDS